MTSFWAVLVGKLTRAKTIVVSHNTFLLKSNWKLLIYFFVFKWVNQIVTVSGVQKKQIINEYGENLSPITIIPNGIDTTKFNLPTKNEEQRSQPCCIGTVARLEQVKGVDIFLEAARLVVEKEQKVKFLIVGGGSKQAELIKLSKDYGLDEYVTFLGERNDIPELIQKMDITVLSSRSEAMPMAILEYMALKKPVIASNVGGVEEMIQHRVNGLLIPSVDPAKLANTIIELINDSVLKTNMAVSGYHSVQEKYRIETTVGSTETLFESLVNT